MAQTIKLKRSSVSGNTPGTSDLELGEVAINTYDGKMFIKKNDGSDSIVEIGGSSGTVTEAFKTISVSGQSNVVADSATDTLTLVAGSNMTITTNAGGDTITFASSGGGGTQNVFNTFAVSGQTSVVADSTTDTLTLAAGSGIGITTNAGTDTITIANTNNLFSTVAVSGQSNVVADGTGDTLTFVAGSGITLTTDASADSVTITNSATGANAFGNILVSGQSTVAADSTNDNLTLVAGSNMTITTNASNDTITFASSGGGGGGSQNVFSNIGVSGQGTIQADATTDTLTFEAGSGISLATDTTNDKLTITNTGTVNVANAASTIKEFKYDISSSTTTITGSDANSNTLAYEAGAIQVFLNGILLDPATDYTATNGTSVVLTDAAVNGDDVQIVAFNRKIVTANVGIDTFTGNGSTTAYTLSSDPVNENNTRVHIDGVYQEKAAYSVSGTTLTFSAAPPNGSSIEVEVGFTQAQIGSTLDFADNALLRLGTGNDLQIVHDGSNSIIKDTGTGDLQIAASTLEVKNAALNETMIKAIQDGSVELYHNNAKKLETVTGGVTVTGTVTATTFSGDLSGTINTGTTGTTQSASDNSTKIATTAYVDTAVTNLVDSAPGTLNTLNELAAALGDDANFSTSVTNSLATKVGITAATGAANMPAGTTAQRPGSPAAGQFRYNSTLSQFEGYTSSWGAIGGGGTNTFTTDIFTANGSTTAFTLSQVVTSPNECIVHIDGIYQTPTDAYTVSGTTITFSSAPANTRKIVVYSVKAGVSGNNLNIQTFSGNGSATSFTMNMNPINENNTIVHIDGVYQQKTSYSTSGTTLSFSAAPANDTMIEVATFTQTAINVPVNDTIDTVHIKDDAVTSAKLGGNLVAPGTVTASAGFVGPLTGNVTGNVSGSAATVTGAAQSNITSVGTLSSLTVSGALNGTLSTAAQTNITSVGTLSSLTTSGFAKADNYQFYQNSVASGVSDAIYRKTTATMAFKTGSTERMLIDSNGNLGVGTGSTTVASRIMLTESAYARLTLNQSTTGRNWQIGNDGNNFYIYDATAAVRALDIKSDGKVGIGVSNPESGLHLYDGTNVGSPQNANRRGTLIIEAGSEGSADIQLLNASYSHIFFGDAADPNTGMIWYQHAAGGSGADSMHFGTAGKADDITIKSDGFVGIGESNPARRLSVRRDTGITAGFNDISQFLDTTLGVGGSVSLNLGRANSSKNLGKMAFKYAGSGSNSNALNFGFYDADNLMTLTADGNLSLTAGKFFYSDYIRGLSDTNTGINMAGSDILELQTGGSARLKLEANGNSVFQGNNHTNLQVKAGDNSTTAFLQTVQGTDARFGTSSNHQLNIATNGQFRLSIKNTGEVGIGTTNPTEALEVAGSVKLTGSSRILLPNFWIGPVPNTANNNSGAVLLVNLSTINASNVGFQFSGSIIGNSYTGQAFVNVNIVKHYSNDNIAFKANASDEILTSTVTRMQLNLCTITYSGSSYLAIVKNGGGTGTIQLNGYFQGWYPSQVTEVASGTYTITTNHGNLNF